MYVCVCMCVYVCVCMRYNRHCSHHRDLAGVPSKGHQGRVPWPSLPPSEAPSR